MTVIPRSDQSSTEGTNMFTIRVSPLWKYTESISLVCVSRPVPWQHQNEL